MNYLRQILLTALVLFPISASADTPAVEDESLAALRGIASNIQKNRDGTVRFVRFSKPIVTDEHVAKTAAFANIDYLAVVTPRCTDAGLTHLGELTNLDSLVLSDSGITDATLKKIQSLPKLERLYLDRTQVTDQGLSFLADLTLLKVLSLDGTAVSDVGLKHLQHMKSLEVLSLSGSQVTDQALPIIARMTGLKTLFLDDVAITGSTFEHLKSLEQLEFLSLRNTQVDHTYVNGLVKCASLRHLLVAGTDIRPKHIRAFPPELNVTLSPASGEESSAYEEFLTRQAGDQHVSQVFEHIPSRDYRKVISPISARIESDEFVPDFQRHVIPLLGRLGCNGRTCHGSFQGQGGFSLSMFGYDFEKDHEALTGGEQPRVDIDRPDESLMIYKPTHADDHGGGERFQPRSWQHLVMKRWIEEGAKGVSGSPRKLARFEVTPETVTFNNPGESVQLRCFATWADGTREDVTPLTRFQTNDDVIAEVTSDGEVTCKSPGDTYVISFYDNGIFSTQVVLPVTEHTGENFPAIETPTPIDRFVTHKLSQLGVIPSDICTDEEFLRRVSLDICGTLPTPAEINEFLANPSSNKRQDKIDALLESSAYADWWSIKLADLTGSNAQYLGTTDMNTPAAIQWNQWLRRRIQDNVGWDDIAAGIILSRSRKPGQSYESYVAEQSRHLSRQQPTDFTAHENPMHYYWFRSNNQLPTDRALSFGYVFMGVRLQCAQCHKHPFDQWSKQDFEQFTQFFTRIKAGVAPDAKASQLHLKTKLGVPEKLDTAALRRQMYLRVSAEGLPIPWNEVWIESPGQEPQVAKLLGGEEVDLNEFDNPLQPLMEWLLRSDNPYFAPAFVNRVWEHYFGAGIVDPPDDFNMANPPGNKELLSWLSTEFINSGYDLKWLHRTITSSRTYQLSWQTNKSNRTDDRNFSHALIRRLPAEVTIDAILQATANTARLKTWSDETTGRKITQHPKSIQTRGIDYSLLVFGKPLRTTNCDCERQQSPTLVQSLFVRNDHEINEWLQRGDGWLLEIAREINVPLTSEIEDAFVHAPSGEQVRLSDGYLDELVDEVYLRTLSRLPSRHERKRCLTHIAAAENPAEGLRDVLWALINTQEFLTNH